MLRQRNNYRYGEVNVLLHDQNLAIRRLIRGALGALGFVNIREARNVDDIIQILNTISIDLLCIDLDTDTERVCEVIRDIRYNEAGPNPFLVVVAMTWHPERDLVMKTLNAGTDDLVTKPVSAEKLRDRVTRMVEERKRFVVTQSYIGPDRRHGERVTKDDLPTIQVPNSLRHKAAGDADAELTPAAMEETLGTVKTHLVYRIAMQIGIRAQKLEQRTARDQAAPIPRQQLAELAELIQHANQTISRTRLHHLERIGTSMSQVMRTISRQVYQTPRHFEVLRLHAYGIVALIREDDRATQIVAAALDKAVDFIEHRATGT